MASRRTCDMCHDALNPNSDLSTCTACRNWVAYHAKRTYNDATHLDVYTKRVKRAASRVDNSRGSISTRIKYIKSRPTRRRKAA